MMLRMMMLSALLAACDEKEDSGAEDTGTTDTGTTDTGTDTGTTTDTVTMVVDNHQVICHGEGQWICPMVQIDGGDWEQLGCGVGGLSYEWGTTYTITAELTGFSDPASDGCGDVYDLVSIDSETFDGASASFTFEWVYDATIAPNGTDGGTIGSAPFVCADEDVCAIVSAIKPTWQTLYDLTLRNPAKQGDPMVLTEIVVAE